MKKHALILGLVTLIALPATADNVYVYGDIGRSRLQNFLDDLDNAVDVGIGYKLNSNLSVDVGYHDLGKHGLSELVYYPGVRSIAAYLDINAIQFSALASLPITDIFSIHARLGYAHIKSKITLNPAAFEGSVLASDSISENKVTYGIGANFKFNEKITWRADYIKFGNTDISSATIGASYTF